MDSGATNARQDTAPPPWTFPLFRVAGIPIRVHFTFPLLLIFLGWVEAQQSNNVVFELLFVLALFGCVLLHELGHALVARRFGIRTADIVLYPIGGVARLDGMGKPPQEFWIAIAGPLVNVAIAAVILLGLLGTNAGALSFGPIGRLDFAHRILLANIILAGFNLLPAFPMDGGRILRAILAQKLGMERATNIAAAVGQGFAVIFGIAGLLTLNFILVFIAFFLFIGASGEAVSVQTQSTGTGYKIRDAMITRFETLSHGQRLNEAVDVLLSGSQQDFPVVLGDRVLGILPREQLFRTLAREGRDAYVSEAMLRDIARVGPEDDLSAAFEHFSHGRIPLLVFEDERLIGMVTAENLGEFVAVRQSMQRSPHRA